MFRVVGALLLLLDLLLAVAHLLWPDHRWGQSRSSYFNFENTLTLASWLAAMQFVGAAVLAVVAFHRERRSAEPDGPSAWPWLAGCLTCLVLSFAEITRIHERLDWLNYPEPNAYGRLIVLSGGLMLLTLFGSFVVGRLGDRRGGRVFGILWLLAWVGSCVLRLVFIRADILLAGARPYVVAISGLLYLAGGTLLLLALGEYVLTRQPVGMPLRAPDTLQAGSRPSLVSLVGVGGTTFIIIFLQVILFQMLTVFGDYLDANSVISIALLGIAIGGIIGFFRARRAPRTTMIVASLLLPLAILLAFGSVVELMRSQTQLLASILLTVPFVVGSTVITVALVESDTHLIYCIDLLGAGLGALVVSFALEQFREEGSLFFLAALAFVVLLCFVFRHPSWRVRGAFLCLALVCGSSLVFVGWANLSREWLNIVRTKVQRRYPDLEMYFSRSSFVGRYDVLRQTPDSTVLKSVENGRTIDTIRNEPVEHYQIDPRLSHTWPQRPDILIIGVSGDAITKTARFLGNKVYGVEINPVIVDLMQNELAPYNADSYKDIEVEVMDGRSYLAQTDRKFDVITLMNAHFARGSFEGRAPCPEYLHTYEAVNSYLDHLTERGHVILEEVNALPEREPAIWKALVTLRQALVDRGATNPEDHFFIFQWRTRRNNYIQIVMTKNPMTSEHVKLLKQWLRDVDNIQVIGREVGHRMGPILTATTTLLHAPGVESSTNYSRIIRGDMSPRFMERYNLRLTTDDRPFPFDISPQRLEFKEASWRTLLLLIPFLPFFGLFLIRHARDLGSAVPYALVVMLTGLGYFLVEMVSIQRVEIFLGSPVVGFATVLGTLLIGSGLGSLWSGRLGNRGLYGSLLIVLVLLGFHLWASPAIFEQAQRLPLPIKISFVVCVFAPLAFFMGVPFPMILRMGKERFTPPGAAMLFAINAASSAVVIPLAIFISTVYGLHMTFLAAMVIYGLTALVILALQRRVLGVPANALAAAVIAVLVCCPWIPEPRPASAPDTLNPYDVYAISYGRSRFAENKLIQGRSNRRVRFQWMCWLIRGHGRTILVDTGIDDPGVAAQWGLSDFVPPVERLAEFGVRPEEITDVILTHAHWDHMGDLAPYRNARIWIQETEYRHAVSRVSEQDTSSKGMRWNDVRQLLEAEREGRVHLVRGRHPLTEGVIMVEGGAHTPGSQYVEIETLDGWVVLAGDATYMYENNRRHLPIGTTVDPAANLAAIRKMHLRAASPFFIIPGHDPAVLRWFPLVSPGIVKITADPNQ